MKSNGETIQMKSRQLYSDIYLVLTFESVDKLASPTGKKSLGWLKAASGKKDSRVTKW